MFPGASRLAVVIIRIETYDLMPLLNLQIDDPSDVQQMLTEELEVARAAQAAQQVKLLELTAELKRVQQQLLEAEERSSQLEHFYEEVM